MEHFAIHKLSKTHTSLLPKVSNSLCCGNPNSAVYFYHSDHLGSASWITNGSGTPVQHLQYMPYGEPFVNERTSAYEERFTFTGKERDSETGFSYFGARYYDSDLMTGWLSVDPMADKYPSLSPYAYCAWNPVKLVDPDGEEIWIVNSNGGRLKYTVGMSSKGFDNYTTETINALNKLSQTKTLGIQINQLARADENRLVVNILECSGNTEFIASLYEDESKYYPPVQKILFDPYLAIEDISTNKTMSPALSLGHELMHLYNLTTDLPGFLERRNDKTRKDIWTDEEEFYNITTWEWDVANEWNELKRKSHKMTDKNGNKIYDFINVESSTLETK